MKKQRGKAKGTDEKDGFVKRFSPFAYPLDEFAIVHWFFPIFGSYILSKIVGIPIWFRIREPWLAFGEDKFYLLFAFVLVLVVLAFHKWSRIIPHALVAFIEKGLIVAKSGENSDTLFFGFLESYQLALKSRKRFLIIIPFLLFLGWILVRMISGTSDIASEFVPLAFASKDWFMVANLVFFYAITPFLWGYLVGVGAWIMGVTGWYLWKLPNQFEIRVQPNHPDKCGGLRFLGDFCFGMVIPILIGAVLLGIIGLVGELLPASDELRLGSNLALLLFALPLTYITFFTPMWGIHTEMQKRKIEFQEKLANHISKLDAKVKLLLDQEKFEDAKKSLGELDAIRTSSEAKFPVWPFDLAILAGFLTPQLVPMLSFVFGIKNEDFIKVLEYLVN